MIVKKQKSGAKKASKQQVRRLEEQSTAGPSSIEHYKRPSNGTQMLINGRDTAGDDDDDQELEKLQTTRGRPGRRTGNKSEENDEENIVIDMPEEDDEDEEQAKASRGEEHDEDEESPYGTRNNNLHATTSNSLGRHSTGEQDGVQLQFNVGDLIWFDPNQLGYSIPGKVLDFYPELNVLTVEGCGQPLALEDPQLDEETRNRLLVKADEHLQVYELSEPQSLASVRPRRPIGDPLGFADLVQCDELSLETIIWNLKLRFKQDLVYTKCGRKILLSLNPHKQLGEIYNLDQVNRYDSIKQSQLASLAHLTSNKLIRWLTLTSAHELESEQNATKTARKHKSSPSRSKTTPKSAVQQLPAHIFGLANEALASLLVHCQDQCFILLGDSGSGKTEAAKLLVQYFATVNKSPTNLMTEQILESIQLLESFGNAKTILNNNSSRFGKLLELRFNLASGFIQDAKTIDLNLLDRSRIVCQNVSERNFNIFYELLAGLSTSEKEKYGLQSAEKYFYLNQGHCVELATKDDAEDFRSLLASMQVLGFNYEEQDTIFRILATILHLGNIYFHRKMLAVRSMGVLPAGGSHQHHHAEQTGEAGVEGVEIGSDTEARWVSHLLQVQFDLVMRCLTVRTIETPSSGASNSSADCIVTPLNIDQALDTRDAIARALYTCLFKWLVQRINLMINEKPNEQACEPPPPPTRGENKNQEEPIYLCRTGESLCEFQPDKLVATQHSSRTSSKQRQQQQQLRQQTAATISILDAFGFENLAENNFEQLCVNYAAEFLHYHTNRYLVRLEQVEYARERIRWQPLGAGFGAGGLGEPLAGTGEGPYASLMASSNQLSAYGSLSSANTQVAASSSSNSLSRQRGCSSSSSSSSGAIVSLISKKPQGILALLDDECNFPKATDQSFAEKCHHQHALNDNYQCARLAANSQEFGIRHFRRANRMVWYQVEGFIEKNRDSLRPDVMELLLGSKMSIVADMLRKIHHPYRASAASGQRHSGSSEMALQGKTLSRTYDGRYVAMKPRAATVAARFQDTLANNRVIETLACLSNASNKSGEGPAENGHPTSNNNNNNKYLPEGQHGNNNYLMRSDANGPSRGSLASQQAQTWFIVCIKPNRTKSPQVFDVAFVQDQVRAMNLLELAQARKFGFPVRLRYAEFLRRYKCLVSRKFLAAGSGAASHLAIGDKSAHESCTSTSSLRELCASIVEQHNGDSFQCGLTKMFLSEKLFHQLEQVRLREYLRAIMVIQKTWKMWLSRREFLAQRLAAIVIQAHVRGFLESRRFERQYVLLVRLQRRWRRVLQTRRRERLEARRALLKQQQREQLEQLQAHQAKVANQTRFRLQAIRSAHDKSLDIPEDLAQLYRLQRNWLPIHDLSNLNELNLIELVEREQLRRLRLARASKQSHPGGQAKWSVPFMVLSDEQRLDLDATLTQASRRGNEQQQAEMSKRTRDFIEQLELDERFSLHKFLTKYFTNQEPQFGYSRLPITRPFTWSRMLKHKKAALRRAQRFFPLCHAPSASQGAAAAAAEIQMQMQQRDSEIAMREESIQRRFLALEQKALAVYKLILRYIDSDQSLVVENLDELQDEATGAMALQRLLKFKLISDYINYLCLTEPHLRDEVFLQLASQTWQNPKVKSQENCWKLMLNCLACFGPHSDRHLLRHLIKYASDFCCPRYRAMVCERLVAQATTCQRNSAEEQRRFPSTILEYWANQQATGRLAVSASCYMDDSPVDSQAGPAEGQAEGHQGDDNQDEEAERFFNRMNAINYSNKTLAQVNSRTTAEQLARDILEAREVPPENLVGWSIEIQHEGALSEFSSRLRGDDHLFDHFARLELLPELVQLIDDDLEALECEQLDELGVGVAGGGLPDEGGEFSPAGARQSLEMPLADDLPSCCRSSPPSSQLLPDGSEFPDCCQQVAGAERQRFSGAYSQRSWDLSGVTNFTPSNRHSVAMSDLDYHHALGTGGSNRSSGQPMSRREFMRLQQQQQQQMNDDHHLYGPRGGGGSNLNRRSMSMQELQLAASSALNGRYFTQQQQQLEGDSPQQHYAATSCFNSACCPAPPPHMAMGGPQRSRRLSGSLRQLDHFQPFGARQAGRRRSATPNSMVSPTQNPFGPPPPSSRLSSSAYGSHNSRHQTTANGSTGGQPVYMSTTSSVDGRHSAMSQSRRAQLELEGQRYGRPRVRNNGLAPPASNGGGGGGGPARARRSASSSGKTASNSDYASAVQSDAYEQIGGRQRPKQAPGQAGNQRKYQAGRATAKRPSEPLEDYPQPRETSAAEQGHYAATSSALSDTSEAPSLASHVRGVKVPQVNGDLDRYLDDLFNPLLDECDLGDLSDARSLATSIRGTGGTTSDDETAGREGPAAQQADEQQQVADQEGQRAQTLSPTFESLLKSLKTPTSGGGELAADEDPVRASLANMRTPANLNEMNLSELKALNERLESEIQAAQSTRASLEFAATGGSEFAGSIDSRQVAPPAPPPQPCFAAGQLEEDAHGQSGTKALVSGEGQTAEQLIDDIYSRAKTIRIGKWRWPPARDEAQPETAAEARCDEEDEEEQVRLMLGLGPERKRTSVLSGDLLIAPASEAGPSQSATTTTTTTTTTKEEISPVAASLAAVGRLKISNEMKAKLEQLTNSSSPGQSKAAPLDNGPEADEPTTTGQQQKSAPGRLGERRRNLLANQLAGSSALPPPPPPLEDKQQRQDRPESSSSSGSKVLAVKQQLAAAAGVALSAFDNHQSAASSQASSRRQSSHQISASGSSGGCAATAAAAVASSNEAQRRLVLEADELGPQSREAVSQRQAFYLHAGEGQAESNPHTIEPPALPKLDRATGLQNAKAAPAKVPSQVGGDKQKLNLVLHKHRQEIAQAGGEPESEGDQWVQPVLAAEAGPLRAQRPAMGQKSISKMAGQLDSPEASQRPRRVVSCLTHANVDWQVRVRKEVFRPSESYDNELVVQLIFAQLVADVFNPRHWTRLNNKERAAIKSIMKDNSIGYSPSLPPIGQMQTIKRELVRMARSFGLYFTRSYQALNFACLAENHLAAGEQRAGSQDESDSCDGSESSSSSSSPGGSQASLGPSGPQGRRSSLRATLRLARELSARERLGAEWIDMVAVHHSGLRLVALVCDQPQAAQDGQAAGQDRLSIRNSRQFIANQIGGASGGPPTPPIGYKVLETLKFRDMSGVRQLDERTILIGMERPQHSKGARRQNNNSKSWLISSSQANQLAALLEAFLRDYNENVRIPSGREQATSAAEAAAGQRQKHFLGVREKRSQRQAAPATTRRTSSASEFQAAHSQQEAEEGLAAGHTTSSKSKRRKNQQPRASNEDALLAPHDDHDGHRLEQRQAANSFDKLRKAARANDVLADPQRVLPDDPAPPGAANSSANTTRGSHSGPGELVDGEHELGGGGGGSGGERKRARGQSGARGGSANDKSPATGGGRGSHSARKSSSRSPSASESASQSDDDDDDDSGSAPESSSDLSGAQSRARTRSSGSAAEKPTSDSAISQPAPSSTGGGKANAKLSKNKQASSVWQNSLSRMSNKFSLFGSSSAATAAGEAKSASAKSGRARSAKSNQTATSSPSKGQDQSSGTGGKQQQAVTLDAWIETKVDFDAEDEEQERTSSTGERDASASRAARLGSEPAPFDTPRRPAQSSDEDPNPSQSNGEAKQAAAAAAKPKQDDGKYSMLQFALYNFREAIEKYSLETRLSMNGQSNNNNNNLEKNGGSRPAATDDWSTLRGSLKLIESMRNGSSTSHSTATTAGNTSSGSNQSTLSSARTLGRANNNNNNNNQQRDEGHTGDSSAPSGADWTWRELAEMVKFTRTPLKRSLLKLASQPAPQLPASDEGQLRQQVAGVSAQELERRAIDCFAAIMRYMGDLDASSPIGGHQRGGKHQQQQVPDNEVECVYLILINCHNFPQLRDEVYCQLIKQTTNNRSEHVDSCLRGWRLFSLLAAYFDCSPNFRPYLVNYLEQNAFDKRRSYHSIALLCLQNLRKTFKFKGRKNVPSIEEIAALSAGRISKRQIYRLPGGTERVINTKSTTVVQDIIYEICSNMLMIEDTNEMLEFSLYCIADGDLYTMPLSRDEYILDITTELIKNHQQYFLIFCRSIWHYPLRLDSKLYIEVTFNQIAPDYLEGLLLVLPRSGRRAQSQQQQQRNSGSHYATSGLAVPGGKPGQQVLVLQVKLIREIARLAALLHRASGTDYTPHKDEIKYLLPKPIVASIKQQLKLASKLAGEHANPDAQQQIYAPASTASSSNFTTTTTTNATTTGASQVLELEQQQAHDSVITPNQATWVQLVQNFWREMSAFDTLDAKAQFLDIIRHWPLFGSSFFAIKLIQRDLIQPMDFILALNKFGVQMLDTQTHETHHRYSFNEVISTRKVRSEDGALYLDMKCGTLMKRTIIRIQTDQAHEISRLIRQYIDIELLQANHKHSHQQASSPAASNGDQQVLSPTPSSAAASVVSSNERTLGNTHNK